MFLLGLDEEEGLPIDPIESRVQFRWMEDAAKGGRTQLSLLLKGSKKQVGAEAWAGSVADSRLTRRGNFDSDQFQYL
jgi:hypothetical protein